MRQRAKPNTLYGIVKMLTSRQLAVLREFYGKYAQTSKQWALVEYYFAMEAWSRKQELADWEHLDVLKSRTFKWLIRAMSKTGMSPHHEMHALVGDIGTLLAMDDYNATFEFIAEAKALGWTCELFTPLRRVLEQELLAIQNADGIPERVKEAQAVLKEIAKVDALVAEINHYNHLRAKYLFAYQEEYLQNGVGDPKHVLALKRELEAMPTHSIQSVRALYEWQSLATFCNAVLGNKEEAASLARTTINLYDKNLWLAEGNLARYFSDTKIAISLAAELGERDYAIGLLARLENASMESGMNAMLAMDKFVKVLLKVATEFGEEVHANKAVQLFEAHRERVVPNLEHHQLVEITFCAARFCLYSQRYADAKNYLAQLLDLRKGQLVGYFVHGRAMELLCLIGLREDNDNYLHSKGMAALKFIDRQYGDTKIPKVICNLVTKLSNIPEATDEALHQIQASKVAINKITSSKKAKDQLYFVDYERVLTSLADAIKKSPQ